MGVVRNLNLERTEAKSPINHMVVMKPRPINSAGTNFSERLPRSLKR